MSDDLVKRLRDWENVYPCDYNKPAGTLYFQAADRIEADALRIAELEADFSRQVERTDEQREAYEARITELALDALAAGTQADEAYQAQLAAEARVKVLEDALRWYHDQMCEGFCKDLRYDSTYTPEMDDVCAGCKARAALEGEK